MVGRDRLSWAVVFGGLGLLAASVSGCSSLEGSHVDCNVVRLQREAGRSDADIASALGVSVPTVESCQAGGASPASSK
jgi:hypothetical protein